MVKEILKATFPDYKGRNVSILPRVSPVNVTSFWQDGSRDYFAAVELGTWRTMAVPQNGTPFDGGPIAPNGVVVPPGFAIVEHGIFRGKSVAVRIYVNPENMAGLLLAGTVPLTLAPKHDNCDCISCLPHTY